MYPQGGGAAYRPDPVTGMPTPQTVPLGAGDLVPATAAPMPVPYGAEPILLQVGQIQVTATTVHTPNGSFPVRGSMWTVTDRGYPTSKIPTWAIVLAIVLFFVIGLFSLLFLLAKETQYQGFVEVFVANGGRQFVAQLPGGGPANIQYVHQQVNYARMLASR
jgi:hypothetical protein